jgi:hypothetical protein
MLGYQDGDLSKITPAGERAVARGIKELTDAGLIKAIGHRNGNRKLPMVYQVMGWQFGGPASLNPEGSE